VSPDGEIAHLALSRLEVGVHCNENLKRTTDALQRIGQCPFGLNNRLGVTQGLHSHQPCIALQNGLELGGLSFISVLVVIRVGELRVDDHDRGNKRQQCRMGRAHDAGWRIVVHGLAVLDPPGQLW